MRALYADLHIHTCLSPCAESRMSPSAVVAQALRRGLDVIAVCDHNSAENVEAVSRAGQKAGLAVIGGMEITSREEVHVLGLFGRKRHLHAVQDVVYDNLHGQNDPETFGQQLVADENDTVVARNDRLLIGATALTLSDVVGTIHAFDGIAIASHVDRPSFSVLSQLGFIPEGLGLDAVEVSSDAVPTIPQHLPVVTSSDAHRPEDIGTRCTRFLLEQPTSGEIALALRGARGRRILDGGLMQDLSLHILDVAENSLRSGATLVEISVLEDTAEDLLALEIRDNGQGMDPETAARAADPFYSSKPGKRVGLGLAMLAQAAREGAGRFDVSSRPGEGTTVKATFQHSHPDRKPLGDIAATLQTLVAGHPDVDFVYEHTADSETARFDTREVRRT